MKNFVRGGAILLLTGLFVVFIYAQTRVDAPDIPANDQDTAVESNIADNNIANVLIDTQKVGNAVATIKAEEENNETQEQDDDKKLVKKTASVKSTSMGVSRGSFSATAYCLSGRTAMGHGVRRGIIAADPRVLKLGSKVYVSAGKWSGTYLVSDTGGRIKGKKVDIWVPSCSEARRFGRRSVQVFSAQ